MRRAALLAAVLASAAWANPMLFVYFKEPANMGIFFASSMDGCRWQPLNGGKPWLPIEHAGELMRDPFLTRGPDKEFHLVWTWGWRGTSIGYAHSPDLVHWSEQREVPIVANIAGAENAWAPEIYWEPSRSQWMVVWSSRTAAHEGNRIYRAWTADFKNFTKPEILWDPGYPVIDATILQARGQYYMVFKDETVDPVHRWLKTAESATLAGPYGKASEAFTESWSEGPSAVRVGDDYIVYYDHYRDPKRYEAVRSKDMAHWTAIDGEVSFPEGSKHGSFLTLSEDEFARLKTSAGSVAAAMAAMLPDLYHDERHGDPPYLIESGWHALLDGKTLAGWHAENNAAHEWFTAPGVTWRRVFSPTHLNAKVGAGDRIVNGKDGKTANLVTDAAFGSFEIYLEFLLAKGSNSGLFLHGLYEIQIFDSFGYDGPLQVGDCGGIYEREQGGGGSPPACNTARPPGEWQSLRVWFQAPQFDRAGKMMARPKVLRVLLNEAPVQSEFTLDGPTVSHLQIAPAARNPIMLQGDHGPVAFRNIYVKEVE